MLIRERPRLALMLDVAIPGSNHARWGLDEHQASDVPSNLTFSSTMPGGFEQMACSLARKAATAYPDLSEFATVTVSGAGGEIAWQGRLETSPRTSGSQLAIQPGAVGWQAALDDNQSARMIYIDRDLAGWVGPSLQRQVTLSPGSDLGQASFSAVTDDTGNPGLVFTVGSVPFTNPHVEAWYRAPAGVNIASARFQPTLIGFGLPDSSLTWNCSTTSDDVATGFVSVDLKPSNGVQATPSVIPRQFFMIELVWTGSSGGSAGVTYGCRIQHVSIVGDHGLTIQGVDYTSDGVLASDVVQHAVSTWAPQLSTSRAGVSTIEPSTIIIPQLAFTDPTTASNIIKQATQYGLPDWWVDEGPTFNLASRENHGRRWRARVGPSGLAETGPQVDRLFNSVIVSYNDVTGITRTVGPTGSDVDTIDDSLTDADPSNPVTAAGLTRRSLLAMGITSTVAGATQVGRDWLAEQKLLSTAGQAQIIGHVEDDHGVLWPAWMIRAGDSISFTDAHDTSYRRVVRSSYSDSSRSNQLDLDSPAEGLQALLARLSVSLTPLGLS